jgi:hypothetical protein
MVMEIYMMTDKRTLEILTQVVYKELRKDTDIKLTDDDWKSIHDETLKLAETIEKVQKSARIVAKKQEESKPPFESTANWLTEEEREKQINKPITFK